MSNTKTKTAAAAGSAPIWCHGCFIRIAPYDRRTAHQGKDYHNHCFLKISGSTKSRAR